MRAGIPLTLIVDSMAGHFMSQGRIHKVLVGSDRIAGNGDIANKIGTYMLAVLARENNIPFYAVAPTSTFDSSITDGREIVIEERNQEEVTTIKGHQIAPFEVTAANPAFDVTPAEYITAIICEKGILYPPFDVNIAQSLKSGEDH